VERLEAYIPIDRRWAIANGVTLPDRAQGAVLFADISGFTPLTEALGQELGPRRGADELTRHLNRVYEALVAQVHQYGGSVIGFSGDAITCWFNQDNGRRASACALTMQQIMTQVSIVTTPSGATFPLAIKVAVTVGPVRRFLVGDPSIQLVDVLAGATVSRLAQIEQQAQKGEVLVGAEVVEQLGDQLRVTAWRQVAQAEPTRPCAIVTSLLSPVEPVPWPAEAQDSGGQTVHLPDQVGRSWLLPPVYERLRRSQGQFLAEIRPVVAFFLKFGGLEYDQDEAAGQKLDAYIRWVQQVLARFEGCLIQLTIGDKGSYLYAAFGAPVAHDDDAIRAVAAALELRSPPAELNFITGLHLGLSQGRMRTGAYGSSVRCTYGVLGDEVNVAARLMGKASPGQILVTQPVVEAAAASYHFNPLGLVELKGKQGPIPIFELVARQPESSRPVTAPLVGRTAELAQIVPQLEAVVNGQGQVLRLEGVAGIGKSHLAAELTRRALGQGLRVAPGACQSISQGIPYHPWRQVFLALLQLPEERRPDETWSALTSRQVSQIEALVSQLNPDWLLRLPLLGDLLGLPIPDNATTAAFEAKLRQEAFLALAVELLQTWAGQQPLLVVLEDIHWLDEASQSLVLALSRVIATAPIWLILTQRPQEMPLLPDLGRLPCCQHLVLAELASSEADTLVSNCLGGPPSALLLALIQAYAHGNPFFTEALVEALREAGYLYQSEAGQWGLSHHLFQALLRANCLSRERSSEQWVLLPQAPLSAVALDIPDSVHGVILARLDRLPEDPKLTLKAASVIGPTFEVELLAQAHPARPDPATLRTELHLLEERDFVRALDQTSKVLETFEVLPTTYSFKHNLIQEVTYQTLLEGQQQELNQAVAEALERWQPEAVERLAYYFSHSRVRDKTLCYLDQAARKTQREYANETALNYYRQALALEERWEWRKGQVEILHLLGQREEEREALEVLEVSLSDSSRGAEGQRGRGDFSPAPLLPRTPAEFEAAYLWGQYYEAISEYAQAQAAVAQALAASRAAGDLAGEVRCLTQLGLIIFRQGSYESAKVWHNQALALFQSKKIYPDNVTRAFTQAFNGLGAIHYEQGAYEQAKICYEQALALSRRSGDRSGEANTLFGLGVTAFYQRRFAEARSYYQQALAIQNSIGDRAGEGTTLYNLAQAFTDAGDYNQVEKYLAEAFTILQVTGNRWQQVYVWNDLGILYLTLGDLSRAQSCLEQGLQLAQEIGAEESRSYLLVNLGLVTQFQGNLTTAEQVLTEGVDLAQAMKNKRLVAAFLSYLSTVSLATSRLELAMEQASVALNLRQGLGLRLHTTYDLTTLAAIHLAMSEISQAMDYTEQVLSILEECGGEGPEFPERDYWISYQVLAAAGQAERAKTVLKSAYHLVMSRAERITDLDLRHSFLERVEVNREIVTAYRQDEA
jgi:class 3 adenylate cyclase/tetratricopeptide (TPR) repeat protein